MTTEYESKEKALMAGAYYIGYKEKYDPEIFRKTTPTPVRVRPSDKTIEVYLVDKPNGERIGIGIGRFRKGYDLWIINPETRDASRL